MFVYFIYGLFNYTLSCSDLLGFQRYEYMGRLMDEDVGSDVNGSSPS
jgi:hypothetical protein